MWGISDISLVARAAALHDSKAFGKLVVKYQSPVRRFFLSQTLGDEQLADDLAQDTFVKAYMSIGRFKGLSSFSTWLYRIAYNVFLDYTRRQRPTEDIDLLPTQKHLADNTNSTLRMDIYDALRRLGDKERTCITLQLIDGYKIDRISQITGMPAGTVKSHISRGRDKLAKYLRQNGYER